VVSGIKRAGIAAAAPKGVGIAVLALKRVEIAVVVLKLYRMVMTAESFQRVTKKTPGPYFVVSASGTQVAQKPVVRTHS
jgi:hypothetical protein